MTRHCIFLAVLVCVLACGPGCPSALAAAGPEDSVKMLQKGIDTRDMALVEKYMDVDGVVSKAVEVVITDPEVLRVLEKDLFPVSVVLAMGGAENANHVLRELLTSEVKEYIRHGVVSGAFAGAPQEGASTYQGMFRKAFRGGEKNKVAFGPATVKKTDKSGAILAATLASGTKGRAYPLELRAEQRGSAWRIMELTNAADLVTRAMEKNK